MAKMEKATKGMTFIPFNKVERLLLQEVNRRQIREFNAVLNEIYDENPLIDREATDCRFVLRPDMSGVDVYAVDKTSKEDEQNDGKTD